MSEGKKAVVEIDTIGAERAANAARQALQPWIDYSGKARSAMGEWSRAAGSAMSSMISDIGRVVTSAGEINFQGSAAQVRDLEATISKLVTTSGSGFGAVKKEITSLVGDTKRSQEEIAAFVGASGKITGDYSVQKNEIRALSTFARETGRELTEGAGIGAAFKRMGTDSEHALAQIRADVAAVGSAGGISKLTDQVVALAGAFSKTSTSASQAIAITAQLGKGQSDPGKAAEVQAAIVNSFTGDQGTWQAHFGAGAGLLDHKTGKFDALKAMRMRQAELLAMPASMRFNIAAGNLGSPEAAAAFLNADLSEGAIGGLMGGRAGSNADARFAATPGGEAAANEALRQLNLGDTLGANSTIGKRRRALDEASARHPIAIHTAQAIGGAVGGALPNFLGGIVPQGIKDTITAPAAAYLGEKGAYLAAGITDVAATAYDDINTYTGRREASAQARAERSAIDKGSGDPLATYKAGIAGGLSAEDAEVIAKAVKDGMSQATINVNNNTGGEIEVSQAGGDQ